MTDGSVGGPAGAIAPVRWGVLGVGAIAGKFAADIAHADGASLALCASRDSSRAEAFAARHGGKAASSYAALVADKGIDAVYIATPNALHREHALMAIEAGKAVLVEKPFALTAAEAQDVADAARAAGVFCMEAMWSRFLPVIRQAKRRVEAGEIGAPTLVRAALGFAAPLDPANRFNNPSLGGGALLDLGVYGVSFAHHILGRPAEVACHMTKGPAGADLQAAAHLGYAEAAAELAVSHAGELSNNLEIIGTKGRLVIEAPFIQATRARVLQYSPPARAPAPAADGAVKAVLKRSGLWPLARGAARAALGRNGDRLRGDFPGEGYQFEMEEVARRLSQGAAESEVMPLDESVAVMETLDRLRAAAG